MNVGKVEYYLAILPENEWAYSYSAECLQKELRSLLIGQKLRAVYVDLDGYLQSMHNDVNVIDLSYMGGPALIGFEKTVLQLKIHVEGMIEYRYFPVWELNLRRKFDYPPDDMLMSEKYYFDIANHENTVLYAGKNVDDILVYGTDTWGFSQPHFDETTADFAVKKNDLPTEIAVHTDKCLLRFVADDLEYYWVILEKIPDGELR